ncbi:hypothetical protein C8F04DRAFT_1178284 [Mycena alexandri]|uniref:Uncharacterized protein n=1 Tax=Mycena alexandri TaxID=1745969 RepID=A0AAD6T5K9_9AGAR|nr:hypothetical protein C8F04DRAFT_1178284 [Mycena alexandri]
MSKGRSKIPHAQRKTRKRIAKAERKNLRLWAEGVRESILKPHIEPYGDALERGWRAEREYLQRICNEFHAKISWELQDHEEPDLPLVAYDPLAPVDDKESVNAQVVAKRERITLLNKRIRNWFKYRVRKLRKFLHSKLDPRKDPWAILLAKLSNFHVPPKARQAYQEYFHENNDKIAPVVAQRWAKTTGAGSNVQTSKNPDAAFRAQVARELFAELSEEERAVYGKQAKDNAAAARAKYDLELKTPPSKAPEDRHACIHNVGDFLGPILLGIYERTGLHSVVLMGGPIPEYGGELQSIYVSYGRSITCGNHFPDFLGGRWNIVLDLMKEYLQTAFSEAGADWDTAKRDQEEAALPESPDVLRGAKYTIDSQGSDADDSADGSDSDSSENDSNADSDDTNVPAPKKRKTMPGAPGVTKKTGSAKVAKASAPAKAAKTSVPAKKGTKTDGGGKGKENEKQNQVEPGDEEEDARSVGEGGKRKRVAKPKPKAKGKAAADTGKSKKRRTGEDQVDGAPAAKRKKRTGAADDESESDDEDEGFHAPSGHGSTPTRRSQQFGNLLRSPAHAAGAAGTPAHAARSTGTQDEGGAADSSPQDGGAPGLSTQDRAAPGSHTQGGAATELSAPDGAAPGTPPSTPPRGAAAAPVQKHPNAPRTGWMPTGLFPPPPSASALQALPTLVDAPARQRTPTPLPAVPIVVPEKAPDWLHTSVADLTKVDLGCHYASVVAALIRVEAASRYDDDGSQLPAGTKGAQARPKVISAWVRGGRGTKSKTQPTVESISKFVTEWNGWWDSMQPAWRERNGQGRWRVDPPYRKEWDWGVLDTYGVNGILSAVAGIYFWGVTVRSGSEDDIARWDTAVQDVVWVLEGLESTFKK